MQHIASSNLTFTIRDSGPRRLWVQKYLSNLVNRNLKYPFWRSLIFAVIVHVVVIMFPIPMTRNKKDKTATCHSASSLKIKGYKSEVSYNETKVFLSNLIRNINTLLAWGLSDTKCKNDTIAKHNRCQETVKETKVLSTSKNEI